MGSNRSFNKGERKEVKAPIIDLSIDFDFFVKLPVEFPEYGEPDHKRSADLWEVHNATWNEGHKTHIRHADFQPHDIVNQLRHRGFNFERSRKTGTFAHDDSHVGAHSFFADLWKRDGEPDVLVNMDQHHDVWALGEPENYVAGVVDCANWIRHFILTSNVGVVQIYPSFIDTKRTERPRQIPRGRWRCWKWRDMQENPRRNVFVRHIFAARSSPWTPPYLDMEYSLMLRALRQR
jgi:hypothetical protein